MYRSSDESLSFSARRHHRGSDMKGTVSVAFVSVGSGPSGLDSVGRVSDDLVRLMSGALGSESKERLSSALVGLMFEALDLDSAVWIVVMVRVFGSCVVVGVAWI